MSVESALGLFSVLFVLAIVPGPSDFMVAGRAISAGLFQAAIMILGILVADLILIAVAIFGLDQMGVLLGEHVGLLKYLSGFLLIGFGVITFRSRNGVNVSEFSRHYASSFLGGFLVTLGDPKALVFYFGLLPAFVELGSVRLRDVMIIFGVVTLLICGVKGAYGWFAQKGIALVSSDRSETVLTMFVGVILVGTGIYVMMIG